MNNRFAEIWQQAEALTLEEDEAEAVVGFMRRYAELIVKECIHIAENHPADAAAKIAERYGL